MPHVPIPLQAEGLAVTLVLLVLAFVAAAIIAFVLVAIWLYNDSKQRGENTALWLSLYLVLGLVTTFIASAVVVLIYFATRSKEIKYDRQGNLMVPAAPPTSAYVGSQPSWQSPGPPPTGYASPIAPSPVPPPPYSSQPTFAATSRAPTWNPPLLSKVRCPKCRSVFEYEKQPVGQTHVKCPACGEEGNI